MSSVCRITASKTAILLKRTNGNIRQNDGATGNIEKRLQNGDKYANIKPMRNTRPISCIKAARRDFEEFPEEVQDDMLSALTIAAEGRKSDKAKPFSKA